MTKYMLTSAAALALVLAPVAAMAQSTNSDPGTKSQEMKGPPNTNGMSTNGSSNDVKAGRSDSSGSNGVPAEKPTGADAK